MMFDQIYKRMRTLINDIYTDVRNFRCLPTVPTECSFEPYRRLRNACYRQYLLQQGVSKNYLFTYLLILVFVGYIALLRDHWHHREYPVYQSVEFEHSNTGQLEVTTMADAPMRMHYRVEVYGQDHEVGRTFNVSKDVLQRLQLPPKEFHQVSLRNSAHVNFVTAISAETFEDGRDLVFSMQRYVPNKYMYVYDIGMNAEQVYQVRHWCGVYYRHFNFSVYPEHVRDLSRKSYKSLIVLDALKSQGSALWMDPSIRLLSGKLNELYLKALDNAGLLFIRPISEQSQLAHERRSGEHAGDDAPIGSAVLIYNTRPVFKNVLWWWYLCALDPDCDSPVTDKLCRFQTNIRFRSLVDCERFYKEAAAMTKVGDFTGFAVKRNLLYTDIITSAAHPVRTFVIKTCKRRFLE